MDIRSFPDPFLRKKAKPVKKIGNEEKKLLDEMAKTMYFKGGVGLAAIQVGIDRNLVVIDIGDGLLKLINPVIVKKEGRVISDEEGCLSVPETTVKVRRYKKIVVDYMDEEGQAHRLNAVDLLARVIQHETDHQAGKLIVDYLSPLKKIFFHKRLTTRKL